MTELIWTDTKQSREEIRARDEEACQLCGAWSIQVHEIVGKNRSSRKRRYKTPWLFDPRNRVVLCADCHTWKDANTRPIREKLVNLQASRGYDMSVDPWREYLDG